MTMHKTESERSAQLLLTPPGAIEPEDRALLREHGIVVVETADPSSCQFLRASEVVSSNDMLWAAMDALRRDYGGSYGKNDKAREQLANNIIGLIMQSREATAKHRTPPGQSDS